uniref:Uncharacterized protein n=1 Tax=Dipterosiphonia australica TaxID=2007208 RepID=A0A1Z1MLD2_9FLOR|nr:hypothetical protein [Dipterosiphonia australica]ARW66910.1 hypothetical protein [Dipterosiphonia australica]
MIKFILIQESLITIIITEYKLYVKNISFFNSYKKILRQILKIKIQ